MSFSLCSACRLPSSSVISNLPCEECLNSLLSAPPVCRTCLGLSCENGQCTRPWLRVSGEWGETEFHSVTAVYLSLGPGAKVLKSWKTTPSPSLTRYLLGGVRTRVADFSPDLPLFLIPVPQSAERRWELQGGSTRRFCAMVREARRNPADRTLELLELSVDRTTQALSKGNERYSRRSAIRARELTTAEEAALTEADLYEQPSILLIDDFLTSGSTLRSALAETRRKLGELGWFGGERTQIGVFVLGFRPALFGSSAG